MLLAFNFHFRQTKIAPIVSGQYSILHLYPSTWSSETGSLAATHNWPNLLDKKSGVSDGSINNTFSRQILDDKFY